jgi:dienelactone hydrolase
MSFRFAGWLACFAATLPAQQDLLPGTRYFEFPADIAAEQYAELRAFYEKRVAAGPERSGTRADLKEIIGAVDAMLPPKPDIQVLGESGGVRYSLVEWPVSRLGTLGPTGGYSGSMVKLYGVLLEPVSAATAAPSLPAVVAIADAAHSAADIAGLTTRLPAERQFARAYARRGHIVFAPFFTQRRAFSQPWLDDRVWLMRIAFQTGRHIVGSEALQVSSAVEFLSSRKTPPSVIAAGQGQGGFTALLAAALDDRIGAVVSAGYLDDTTPDWDQPEDRTLWRFRSLFRGDGLARLIAPRTVTSKLPADGSSIALHLDPDREAAIANHHFTQWQAFYRNMALESDRKRNALWKADYSSPNAYTHSVKAKREAYFDTIGRYPAPVSGMDPRSVKLYDESGFTGYRLSVRVYDGVHAYGVLLVPKRLRAGEKRPVVFVQHGLGGKPEDSLGVVANPAADGVYMRFGLRLAERGYIVFAPMIATQANPERQKLIRRCFPIGLIPAGMDVQKFNRTIDYLSTLPFVDASRIGFYGLSYGGYTALWTGPGVPRFQVVITSGHFNDWATKTVDLTLGTAYPRYPNVLDQYNFGLLNRLDYSDLASLIAPRAFLIEMGDADGVIVEPRHTVDAEIEQALDVYRKLGLAERGRVARFRGPHRIDGAEAYPFLDRWLRAGPAANPGR